MFSAETSAELTAAGLDMSSITPNGDGDDTTHKWSELDAGCADAEIVLAYPDAASGTYEYFFEEVLDEAAAGFRTGTQSSDDNVLVNTITGDEAAIGYFGFAYYAENQATLSAAPIVDNMTHGVADAPEEAVAPNANTVRDDRIRRSLPLFMNVNNDKWEVVSSFLHWAFRRRTAVISGWLRPTRRCHWRDAPPHCRRRRVLNLTSVNTQLWAAGGRPPPALGIAHRINRLYRISKSLKADLSTLIRRDERSTMGACKLLARWFGAQVIDQTGLEAS